MRDREKRRSSVGSLRYTDGGESDDELEAPAAAAPKHRLSHGTLLRRAENAVDLLQKQDGGFFFAEPVTDDIVPGYSEAIDQPMDLSTVRAKLKSGDYGFGHAGDGDDGAGLALFASDIRLIYLNALTFNWQPGHEVAVAAKHGLTVFETHLPLLAETPKPASGAAGSPKEVAAAAKPERKAGPVVRTKPDDEKMIRRLREFVVHCGGNMRQTEGWYAKTESRTSGTTEGTYDTYFIKPGHRGGRRRPWPARPGPGEGARSVLRLRALLRPRGPRGGLPTPFSPHPAVEV